MERLIQLIDENLGIEELVWYLEELDGSKSAILHCLKPLIWRYKDELIEDYPWMEIPEDY